MSFAVSAYDGGVIRATRERLCCRGRSEREWLEAWQTEFDVVVADGDEEACALLVDILIAHDYWNEDDHRNGRGL